MVSLTRSELRKLMSTVIHCSNTSTSTTFTSWFQQSHIFSSASWFANEKLKLENSWILLAWWRGSRIAINDILYIFTSLATLLLDLMLPMPLIFHKRLLIMANNGRSLRRTSQRSSHPSGALQVRFLYFDRCIWLLLVGFRSFIFLGTALSFWAQLDVKGFLNIEAVDNTLDNSLRSKIPAKKCLLLS